MQRFLTSCRDTVLHISLLTFHFSLLILSSCSSDSEDHSTVQEPVNGGNVIQPTVTWPLTTQQTAEAQPLNDFTLRLTQQLWHDGDASIVASPLSLAIALSMVNEGAEGETRDEITTALGFKSGQHKQLTDLCASLLKGMTLSGDSVTLEIANACCVNQRFGLYDQYRSILTNCYQAQLSAMDFLGANAVANACNAWCNTHTHGLIPSIVSTQDIDPAMVVLLLNAIYYKGLWANPFNKTSTKEASFHTIVGPRRSAQSISFESRHFTVKVPMMHLEKSLPYMHSDDFAAVELPASVFRMLPLCGSPKYHPRHSSPTSLASHALSLPRFSVQSSFVDNIMRSLKALGVQRPFTSQAQITNVSPEAGLYISLIRQNARIDYYITDHLTGLIAFIGIYNG